MKAKRLSQILRLFMLDPMDSNKSTADPGAAGVDREATIFHDAITLT